MWELLMIAFIKKKHSLFLQGAQTNYKATGVANLIGNKGGLQVTFKLYDV
jgi:hypothetical protein